MTIKKAQTGTKVAKKPAVKVIKKTTTQAKNTKDAMKMENMRPTGPSVGRVKTTMGSAKNGKSFPDLNKDGKITKADILKGRGVIAQKGTSIKGNSKGYNPKTSPLDNTANKGGYEKKMDTIGKGSTRSARLIDGKGNVLGQERLNSSGSKKMSNTYKKEKTDTESRRKENLEFLESRQASGKAASKSMGTMKKGGTVKKMQYGGKAASMVPMKSGGMMKKAMMGRTMMKSGGKMKKAMMGSSLMGDPMMKSGGKVKKGMHKMPDGSMMKNSSMKSGGKMKKCMQGCK